MRTKIKAMPDRLLKNLMITAERTKAQIRARVEHSFHIVKNLFRHRKVRYRGLGRNTANLMIARKRMWPCLGSSPCDV